MKRSADRFIRAFHSACNNAALNTSIKANSGCEPNEYIPANQITNDNLYSIGKDISISQFARFTPGTAMAMAKITGST